MSEEVKSAASYSLGSISIGNLPQYLPFILQNIETQPKKQYLLLHSLKEVISCQSATRNGLCLIIRRVMAAAAITRKHVMAAAAITRLGDSLD